MSWAYCYFCLKLMWCYIKIYFVAAISIVSQNFKRAASRNAFHSFWEKLDHVDLSKSVVITGGTSGVGREAALLLCKKRFHVIIGCRDKQAGQETVKLIKFQQPNARVEALPLDLKERTSIEKFVHEIKKLEVHVNILINNAAVMMCPFSTTKDGYEEHMAVNFLGHVYLTHLLMPLLYASGTSSHYARIVNVSSVVHVMAHQDITFAALDRDSYISPEAYVQSKVAVLLWTYRLERILRENPNCYVSCSAAHPGVANTNLYRHLHPLIQNIKYWTSFLLKTAEEGAHSILYAALNPHFEGRGGYYIGDCSEILSSRLSHDKDLQDYAWSQAWLALGVSR